MNKPQILFFSEDIDFTLDNESEIVSVLKNYIIDQGYICSNINYIFCSDEYLLDLNKQYLNHDYYTDILSFQMDDEPIQGDIFISIDRVKDNAKSLGYKFNTELLRVISHGVLHFLGYKDKSESEKKIMRQKENDLISLLEQ